MKAFGYHFVHCTEFNIRGSCFTHSDIFSHLLKCLIFFIFKTFTISTNRSLALINKVWEIGTSGVGWYWSNFDRNLYLMKAFGTDPENVEYHCLLLFRVVHSIHQFLLFWGLQMVFHGGGYYSTSSVVLCPRKFQNWNC